MPALQEMVAWCAVQKAVLQVEKLDQGAQGIIRKYTSRCSGIDCKLDTATRSLPWGPMEQQDFADLAGVSEYASWVLVNGDRLNHATISVHRLQNFRQVTQFLSAHHTSNPGTGYRRAQSVA